MPGPVPKHSSVRARRNRTSTAATLRAVHDVQAPDLPAEREWHDLTLRWWADMWASPMAPEYDESDRHGLFILAVLVDDFWRKPSADAAAEIRLQRKDFGLTPLDRRRLQWEIERADEAQAKGETRRAAATPAAKAGGTDDPRASWRSA